jgi:hypothetical protein
MRDILLTVNGNQGSDSSVFILLTTSTISILSPINAYADRARVDCRDAALALVTLSIALEEVKEDQHEDALDDIVSTLEEAETANTLDSLEDDFEDLLDDVEDKCEDEEDILDLVDFD